MAKEIGQTISKLILLIKFNYSRRRYEIEIGTQKSLQEEGALSVWNF